MQSWMAWSAAALLLAAGCATQKATMAKVDDSGLARLDEHQMEPVDDARVEEGRAHDAVARARANEANARSRLEVARTEKAVAEAQLRRSAAERDLLKKQYASQDQLSRAQQDIQAGEERVRAADLKLKYLQQLVAVAESETRAAEAHELTAKAATEQAKFRAMKAANAPQAMAVNEGDLDQQLASARQREAESQKQAAERRSNAVSLYNQWQQADSRARTLAQPQNVPVPPPVSEPTPH